MNPLALMLVSTALLIAPWLLMPARGTSPEIRGGLRILSWMNLVYCVLWHRLESGRAPVPETGPAILIANHTCNIDHMLLQAGCPRLLGFLIAREYYESRALHPICKSLGCIPVRRDGHDLSATRAALRALEEGRVVPVFPEGKILPRSGRELGEGKPGVAYLALRARVPVIPAFICGTPATNAVRASLLTPSHARVVYGPPIDLSDVPADASSDRETISAVTERLMEAIRSLQQQTLSDGRPTAD